MHSREHVQLAAYLAIHSPKHLRNQGQIDVAALEKYWIVSKCRLDRWSVRLKTHSQLIKEGKQDDLARYWNAVLPVIEEILIGDILTRVWISICAAHDRIRRKLSAEPVARSVFLGHMESRNRALNQLLHGQGLPATLMVKLNRLRRRSERWTDMLLGYIATETDVNTFGYDHERVKQFAEDIRDERRDSNEGAWVLLLESALEVFGNDSYQEPANPDLNRDIAAAVAGCFPIEFFAKTDLVQPMWEARIWQTAEQTQQLVDQLLSFEDLEEVPEELPQYSISLRKS